MQLVLEAGSRTHNLKVVGSNPTPATINPRYLNRITGILFCGRQLYRRQVPYRYRSISIWRHLKGSSGDSVLRWKAGSIVSVSSLH